MGGMVTYLGLAHILPMGGGGGGMTCSCRCRLCARPRTQTHNERKDPKEKPIPANIAIKACWQ